MIHVHRWRWPILICVLAIGVGILHGLSHVEFHKYYTQLLDDIDEFLRLSTEYISQTVTKLTSSTKADKLQSVTKQYNLMVKRARPLLEILSRDYETLCTFVDTLESVNMTKKLLYTYFRQSAINLIDHLKRVYNLD